MSYVPDDPNDLFNIFRAAEIAQMKPPATNTICATDYTAWLASNRIKRGHISQHEENILLEMSQQWSMNVEDFVLGLAVIDRLTDQDMQSMHSAWISYQGY